MRKATRKLLGIGCAAAIAGGMVSATAMAGQTAYAAGDGTAALVVKSAADQQTTRDMEDARIRLSTETFDWTGKPVSPTFTVTYDGKALVEGTDYVWHYETLDSYGTATGKTVEAPTDVGGYAIVFEGRGEWSGREYLFFYIVEESDFSVLARVEYGKLDIEWTGKAVDFKPSVWSSKERKLKAGRDYTGKWQYRNPSDRWANVKGKPKAIGEYRYVVTGKGSYKGKMTGPAVQVDPPEVKSKKVKVSKRTAKFTWKRSKNADGYYIFVTSTDYKVHKDYELKGASKTSKTVKGLKKGKTYEAIITAYKKVGAMDYQSRHGKTLTFKIPK